MYLGKRVGRERELRDGDFIRFNWEGFPILHSLQVYHIGRDAIQWQVVHRLIKFCMPCYLDLLGFSIIPEDILGSVWEETKEDALS